MSVLSQTNPNIRTVVLSRLPLRTMKRTAFALLMALALAFYFVGRAILKVMRAPRSETGVPEAIFGFMLVAGLVMALVKVPLRLVLAALMR